jgi:hypothetical protein
VGRPSQSGAAGAAGSSPAAVPGRIRAHLDRHGGTGRRKRGDGGAGHAQLPGGAGCAGRPHPDGVPGDQHVRKPAVQPAGHADTQPAQRACRQPRLSPRPGDGHGASAGHFRPSRRGEVQRAVQALSLGARGAGVHQMAPLVYVGVSFRCADSCA